VAHPASSPGSPVTAMFSVDVAEHEARASGGELARDMPAHAAKAADREEASAEIGRPVRP